MNEYPQDIYTSSGRWGRIHQGHGLDSAALQADLEHNLGLQSPKETLSLEEVRLAYQPRIKWCSRVDGFGCDNEGEWHRHWFEVRQNGELFTIAQWATASGSDTNTSA
ncbi:hypothetical protein [Rhodococcoides fascians]|uniref:hypothetical protein n=1 Tax=Rhodococcoides fascians TaxID=1828 RepID=UPI0006911213|nr:hypothetical protein [Rhodococcus fascians]